MDYRKFLAKTEPMVLPYLGGLSVSSCDRRLRVQGTAATVGPLGSGWWSFDVEGRRATARERVDAPDLSKLDSLRGHLVQGWCFVGSERSERVLLLPEEEAPVFAPVIARSWWSGDFLYETLEFEQEAEIAAREALEQGRSTLVGVKGVAPSLRAAFGFAVLSREARRFGFGVSPREVLGCTVGVAKGIHEPATVLSALSRRRVAVPQHAARPRPSPRSRPVAAQRTRENAQERAAEVLVVAGAQLLSARGVGGRNLEVTFRYLGQRFIAVVDWETLHVYDAGICLDGADESLGLDSLPSVINEAVQGGLLYITRR